MESTIKQLVLHLGADDCGIANVDRFLNAPEGFHPKDIYPDCRSVIVFVKRMPKGLRSVNPRICYTHATNINVAELDRITYHATLEIESMGNIAVPLPCDSPYDSWEEQTLTGRGILSMRHAAQLAGLGSLGKNTLLIHKRFGNMVNIGALLTNLDLASDPLIGELCLKNCRLCMDQCPTQAIDGISVDQSRCRPHTSITNARGFDIYTCNRCRMICPRCLGEKD